MKIVEEGTIAPTRKVIHFRRSNQTDSKMIVDAVRSHNQEYSSLSFLLRTNSMMRSSSPMLTAKATTYSESAWSCIASFIYFLINVTKIDRNILKT